MVIAFIASTCISLQELSLLQSFRSSDKEGQKRRAINCVFLR